MSSGRNRTVDGVDVIGVRSVSEAAENQSFLRTAFTQCLSLKRAVMMTGLAGCSFTCKVMRVGEKVGGGGVAQKMVTNEELEQGEYVSVLSLIPIPDSVTSCLLFLDSL